jgi:hypothetical protein
MGSLRKTLSRYVKPHTYPARFAMICGHPIEVTTTISGTSFSSILNSGDLQFSDKSFLRNFVRSVESR